MREPMRARAIALATGSAALIVAAILLVGCRQRAETAPSSPTTPQSETATQQAEVTIRWLYPLCCCPPQCARQIEERVAELSAQLEGIELVLYSPTPGNPAEDMRRQIAASASPDILKGIELVVQFPASYSPAEELRRQVAAGKAPDIIGPIGIGTAAVQYADYLLDLDTLLQPHELTDYNPSVLNSWRVEGRGLLGLPTTVYPSMIWYNRPLFDRAGLPYPPHRYGEPYADGDAWTFEKLEEVAMLLTVDVGGRNAYSAEFDAGNIVQFGFVPQWIRLPALAALLGGGSLARPDDTVALPDPWREALHWYYEGMWEKHFIPNGPYRESALLAYGDTFGSGNVAMAYLTLWWAGTSDEITNWDLAAVPSSSGQVAVPLASDAIAVVSSTEHPEEALEVLYYLAGRVEGWEREQLYLPARTSRQAEALASYDEQFPYGVDWQVAIDTLSYPAAPTYSVDCDLTGAGDALWQLQQLLESTPGLDIDAELDALAANLHWNSRQE